jgi:1-acyl-sn-glycerol-3-phosphate acyltransferase
MQGPLSKRLLRALPGVSLGGKADVLASLEPVLIVANHPRETDPIALAAVLADDAVVIVPPATARHPLCRLLLREPHALTADLSEAQSVRRLVRMVGRGPTVAVFPENGPVRTGAIGKVYEAPAMVAARTGVMVVPVNIRYGVPGDRGS